MIPTDTRQTVHIDSGVVREAVMTISEDATDKAFMLQTVTNLYSDGIMAFLREVSSNARDAHKAAGQTRPIAVTLPTVGDPHPTFVVQDWGTGLNADDFENLYVKFGKSTKRESNDETGMLGLGCKAPLTYCLSFTVVGVKNGVRTVAVITKNEDGIGVMKVLDEQETTDPNGVTVTIPVKLNDVNAVISKAKHFFSFWRDGVLVNGEPPTVIDDSFQLDPDIWVLGRHGSSFVVQGDVPYPYDTPSDVPATVAWVPMGSVKPTPSREQLHYTTLTNDTLATIKRFVIDATDKMVAFRMESCANSYERLKTAYELKQALPYRYQHTLLRTADPHIGTDRRPAWYVYHDEAQKQTWFREQWLRQPNMKFVTNFPWKRVSQAHKARLAAAGMGNEYLVIPDSAQGHFDGFPGISWDQVPLLPRAERESSGAVTLAPRNETLYAFWLAGTKTQVPVYDGSFPVLYVDNDSARARMISQHFPVAVASIIEANQRDRFVRLHPGAKAAHQYLSVEVPKLEKKLTKEDKRYLAANAHVRRIAQHFENHLPQIKDRHLRKLLTLSYGDNLTKLFALVDAGFANHFRTYSARQLALAARCQTSYDTPHDPWLGQNYPLAFGQNLWNRGEPADWVLYLNARHAENKKAAKNAATDTTDDTADAA